MKSFRDIYNEVVEKEVVRKKKGTIEFYEDSKGEYRWRIIAPNGEKIANCGEGYKNKKDCIKALDSVRWHIDNSEVVEKW
jgi:uncharacterized protein YegP (UPF0339 family)